MNNNNRIEERAIPITRFQSHRLVEEESLPQHQSMPVSEAEGSDVRPTIGARMFNIIFNNTKFFCALCMDSSFLQNQQIISSTRFS